jgi:hypothetical protein
MSIGIVTISPTNRSTLVKIKSPGQTSIVSPSFEPKVNVALSQLNDVSTLNVETGYTLIYNSVTQKYEASPITEVDLELQNITGGVF